LTKTETRGEERKINGKTPYMKKQRMNEKKRTNQKEIRLKSPPQQTKGGRKEGFKTPTCGRES